MAIQICALKDQGILEVTYSPDDVTREALDEQRGMVADAISKSGLGKVLIDTSALTQFLFVLIVFGHNKAISTQDTLRKARF